MKIILWKRYYRDNIIGIPPITCGLSTAGNGITLWLNMAVFWQVGIGIDIFTVNRVKFSKNGMALTN